jgi:spore maturation protein CgeB
VGSEAIGGASLKILISGSFWHGSLEESYARAFESLGWQVIRFDWDQYARNHPLAKFAFADKLVRLAIADRVGKWLVSSVQDIKPDLMYVIKGKTINPKTLDLIKNQLGPAPLVNFNPDSPWDSANRSKRLLESIPVYDIHFTWSTKLVDRFKSAGAKSTYFLPFAYDQKLHYPIAAETVDTKFDAVFVGTYSAQRDEILGSLTDFNVGIWGNDWKKASRVPKSWLQTEAIYGEEAIKALNLGAAAINILRPQNEGSHNMRTFEIPASSHLMLTTRSEEQSQWFTEGKEMECYADIQELKEKIRAIKQDKQRARQMAARAYERVREETYAKRAQFILESAGLAR